ncbi:MAG: hypothetical protein V2A74_11735, partial [bacterium]
CPKNSVVALISPARELTIWRDGVTHAVRVDGRVSAAAWSPDGRFAVLTVYPADWSVHAVNNAPTTDEFLRLQNSDLYLLDSSSMQIIGGLTDDPGTEYGAFFAPDGKSLFYIWLHSTENEGGLMRLGLGDDGGPPTSGASRQLTHAGADVGQVPLGRVGTYLWLDDRSGMIFEAGLPDGSGEIWFMSQDGRQSRRMGEGRYPQRLAGGRIAYLAPDGTPSVLAVSAPGPGVNP